MTTIQDIAEYVTTRLEAGTINTTVGGRIYHITAPQNPVLPLVMFSFNDSAYRRTFSNYELRLEADFDIYADVTAGSAGSTGIGTLEDQLYSAIEAQSSTSVTGWGRVYVQVVTRGVRIIDEDAIRSTTRATIRGFT